MTKDAKDRALARLEAENEADLRAAARATTRPQATAKVAGQLRPQRS